MLVILQYFLSQPANQIFGRIVSGGRKVVGVILMLTGYIVLKHVVIGRIVVLWIMQTRIVGMNATDNRENVTGVVPMDGAVEKIG